MIIATQLNYDKYMFTRQERLIYKLNDGTKERWYDPIMVHQKLLESFDLKQLEGDLVAFADGADAKAGADATVRLGIATSKAFDLPQFSMEDKDGWQTHELVLLLVDFLSWLQDLKKKADGLLTSPLPTQEPTNPASTVKLSDFILTDSVPCSDSPQL